MFKNSIKAKLDTMNILLGIISDSLRKHNSLLETIIENQKDLQKKIEILDNGDKND